MRGGKWRGEVTKIAEDSSRVSGTNQGNLIWSEGGGEEETGEEEETKGEIGAPALAWIGEIATEIGKEET